MTIKSFLRRTVSILALTVLAFTVACNRSVEEKEFQALSKKAAELDALSQKAGTEGAEQQKKLQEAGINDVKPNTETMQLTEDQKKALEERIKTEKNSSYQALLQEVLDKDKEIKELNEKITNLKKILPRPDVARAGDNHYSMAIRFLKKKGLSEQNARKLVSRVNIMEKMAPGFEVYHFYSNGVYGTWVSQGKATISPSELQRREREKIENERDTAIAQGEKLQEEVDDLATRKKALEEDIAGLRTEKERMVKDMEVLSTNNEQMKAKLNSLHYVVGNRKKLEQAGVIIVPVFAKDRAGSNWADSVFDQSLDLRNHDTISISAANLGLKSVAKVNVVPGSLEKDKHYTLQISPDKQSATIKILAKERFKNEKVVFAVTD
ncbi:hypothetical protein [Holophaga foetida]|uniref:hypothetical protein n=1 Tax=Holophaga foetida TaxID=35839 RepID=UPI000247427F|nr:hypothetical protein [Holophaga foetida]